MILTVGCSFAPWVVESVSASRMKTLAVILADPNPIHLNPETVRRLGMGDRVINQGPANAGYVLNMLEAAAPGAFVRELSLRFLANVFEGDRLFSSGCVEEIEELEGERRLRCRVWLDIDGGSRALEGTATLVCS
jgi:acyl dehydratase